MTWKGRNGSCSQLSQNFTTRICKNRFFYIYFFFLHIMIIMASHCLGPGVVWRQPWLTFHDRPDWCSEVSYPLEYIPNVKIPAVGGHPKNIIMLSGSEKNCPNCRWKWWKMVEIKDGAGRNSKVRSRSARFLFAQKKASFHPNFCEWLRSIRGHLWSQNYGTEVVEHEGTVVYHTLLFHDSWFLRQLGKK